MKNIPGKKRRRWIVLLVILAVVLPGGYYLARQVGVPAYKNWRDAKMERMADAFYASGDYDNALLTARQVLRGNQQNAKMWRLAVQSAKAKHSPQVVYYQGQLAKLDKTLASQLELIRVALEYNLLRPALDAVNAVGAEGRDSADFHELAAKVLLRVGRPTAARVHLYSLVQLRPDDEAAQLELASVELQGDPQRKDRELRARVERLAQKPALRAQALSLLIKDAVQGKDQKEAAAWAAQLAAVPDLQPDQRVLVLQGLAQGPAAPAAAFRERIEHDFAATPADAAKLVDYFNDAGQAKEAVRWFGTLPEKTRADPGLQQAVAESYVVLRDGAGLNQLVSGAQWGDNEFLRYAFLTYAARNSGRAADASNAWKLAVIRAGDNARNTADLLARVNAWGWEAEKYDLVWKLFTLLPRNDSISRQLIAWERAKGSTSNLNRIFARLFELDAGDRVVRNNFAYTSLLLDSNLAQAYALARENYLSEPTNPYYVTTQAYALYKQGKPADALALIESLRASALSDPERVLCRALVHAANGDAEGSSSLLAGLNASGMLPEEQKLLKDTRGMIANIEREHGRASQLYAMQESGRVDRSRGWLAAVPQLPREGLSKDMLLSDSFFAAGDMAELHELLDSTNWGQYESLRLALLAYVQRERGSSNESRTQWRRALTLAGRDVARLQWLTDLVTKWDWKAERLEAWDRLFDRAPNDPAILAELMAYHRAAGRTGDMVRVLDAYVSAHPGASGTELAEFAYYSMLSGLNVSRAYLNAKQAYEASPRDLNRRLVYAFALWQQKRPDEAWKLLDDIPAAQTETLVPLPLLRAVVLADLNRNKDAATMLADFAGDGALPEENSLAGNLRRKLAEASRVSSL